MYSINKLEKNLAAFEAKTLIWYLIKLNIVLWLMYHEAKVSVILLKGLYCPDISKAFYFLFLDPVISVFACFEWTFTTNKIKVPLIKMMQHFSEYKATGLRLPRGAHSQWTLWALPLGAMAETFSWPKNTAIELDEESSTFRIYTEVGGKHFDGPVKVVATPNSIPFIISLTL